MWYLNEGGKSVDFFPYPMDPHMYVCGSAFDTITIYRFDIEHTLPYKCLFANAI